MENLKEKIIIAISVIVVIVLVGLVGYNYLFRSFTYYTQIDNTKISEIKSKDEMKFEYKLMMYDKNGKSKEIKFKTSRELRESAFLKIKYYAISGVNKWEEVQYNELPDNVKTKYSNN